jgi:PEP-CTERM motif
MIGSKSVAFTLVAAVTLSAPSAQAQNNAPQTRSLSVTYSGIITNDVTDTLMIRQPDGTFTRYMGTVPNYEYKKGDAVTVSFTTNVPTKAYYDANNVPKASDGIYRFSYAGPNGNGNGFGVSRDFDISGSFGRAIDFGGGGITIVYDSNVDTYSLEFRDGGFAIGYFSGPGYDYDATTGALLPAFVGFANEGSGGALLRGNATDLQLLVPTGINAPGGGNSGNFSLGFKGSWNLPNYGGATQVPEPASIAIFAGGLAILSRARRKRASPS